VEFIAKHYAGRPGSSALFGLRPGATIPIELPYGDMWLRPGPRSRLLIAGGTGISAILALLRGLAADASSSEPPDDPVVVAYGAATRPELVRWEEVEELAGRLPAGRAHAALSDPDPGWTGTRGLVTAAVEEVLPEVTAEGPPDVYLAGPPVMVTAVQDVLRHHGVQRDRIHVDSFG
jgi:toluene monooxygenase electron transfer component